jgi:hypothetical protein
VAVNNFGAFDDTKNGNLWTVKCQPVWFQTRRGVIQLIRLTTKFLR